MTAKMMMLRCQLQANVMLRPILTNWSAHGRVVSTSNTVALRGNTQAESSAVGQGQ
jgi:hypothetical protein